MPSWGDFTGLNRGYVLELYEKYRQDPAVCRCRNACVVRAVDAAGGRSAGALSGEFPVHKAIGAVNLAQSIRRYGHLAAQLDPLGTRLPAIRP